MATSKQYLNVLESAKAYVAAIAGLITTVATALLAVYGPETQVGHVLTVAVAVAGAILTFLGTYAIPNADARDADFDPEDEELFYDGHGGVEA